jgi:hypothetical protein
MDYGYRVFWIQPNVKNVSLSGLAIQNGNAPSGDLKSAENTMISGDFFTDGATLPTPDDCYGALNSLGHNLIQTTSNCAIGGTTIGNLTGLDPLLGPLQNNGGPTQTRALLHGSPAIDAGDNNLCSASDQRGFVRPINGGISLTCDIGAFEFLPFSEFLPIIKR